ncbi:MAG: hypothetical protein ACOCW2_02440 [Chitinivibrionales bacterium]
MSNHNGRIRAENSDNRGTSVFFSKPGNPNQ